jgi:ABC-type uncharacterized transport system permease subunit
VLESRILMPSTTHPQSAGPLVWNLPLLKRNPISARLPNPVERFKIRERPSGQWRTQTITAPFESIAILSDLAAVSRLVAAASFGVALVSSGVLLQQTRSSRLVQLLGRLAPGLPRLSLLLGLCASVAHATVLYAQIDINTASLVTVGLACILSGAILTLDLDKDRSPAFMFLSGALCWVLLVLTPFLLPESSSQPSPRGLSLLGRFHVFSAIAGEGIFVLGFLTSLVYLYVHRQLRQRHLRPRVVLPSLESLDRVVERSCLAGLILITSSLVSGLAMTFQGYPLAEVGLIKIVWAFLVWLWYVAALFGRAHLGWQGRKGAVASVFGASLLGIALFGTFWS